MYFISYSYSLFLYDNLKLTKINKFFKLLKLKKNNLYQDRNLQITEFISKSNKTALTVKKVKKKNEIFQREARNSIQLSELLCLN